MSRLGRWPPNRRHAYEVPPPTITLVCVDESLEKTHDLVAVPCSHALRDIFACPGCECVFVSASISGNPIQLVSGIGY